MAIYEAVLGVSPAVLRFYTVAYCTPCPEGAADWVFGRRGGDFHRTAEPRRSPQLRSILLLHGGPKFVTLLLPPCDGDGFDQRPRPVIYRHPYVGPN